MVIARGADGHGAAAASAPGNTRDGGGGGCQQTLVGAGAGQTVAGLAGVTLLALWSNDDARASAINTAVGDACAHLAHPHRNPLRRIHLPVSSRPPPPPASCLGTRCSASLFARSTPAACIQYNSGVRNGGGVHQRWHGREIRRLGRHSGRRGCPSGQSPHRFVRILDSFMLLQSANLLPAGLSGFKRKFPCTRSAPANGGQHAEHASRKNYRKPLLQRYVVRILLMCVPLSALLVHG